MKEQFDKKLADKVKASFDNHQEAYDPNEWNKLAKAYFAKPKGTVMPSWVYWAASITAIALIATFFLLNPNDERTEYLGDNKVEKIYEDSTSMSESEVLDKTTQKPFDTTQKSFDEDNSLTFEQSQGKTPSKVQSEIQEPTQALMKSPETIKQTDVRQTFEKDKVIANTNETEKSEVKSMEEEKSTSPMDKTIASSLKEEEENKALATIEKWLSDGAEKKTEVEVEEKMEPLKLGVYLMPQSTTSSTQAISLGAGIITELPVSKKFKIDLGLAYAQQNIVPGTNSNSNVMVAQSLSMTDRSAMMSSNFITATNELSFGQLEVPFNLKYKVFENEKSDIYLISGVSNMFYLNQRNTVTYNAVSLASSGFAGSTAALTTLSETFTPESQSNSSNVGIGQLLNLSFGYEQNLSNGTFLSIEPFYKLSLGNQTFINQQFSIGGLNLRMNFQLKDKK